MTTVNNTAMAASEIQKNDVKGGEETVQDFDVNKEVNINGSKSSGSTPINNNRKASMSDTNNSPKQEKAEVANELSSQTP